MPGFASGLARLRQPRPGWLVVAAGALLVLAVQVARPVGVPLYDGVVVQEPYRFLQPAGSQPGSPAAYSGEKPVTAGTSPIFAAATAENPPQAQLVAQRAAFVLTPGATALRVSITAVAPPPAPAGGAIAGNVYRFSVTDQSGTPLEVGQCSGCLSLVLRAPEGTDVASIKRFADGTWRDVDTVHAGIAGLYQANATAMGDYAVVAATDTAPDTGQIFGVDRLVAIGGGAVIVLLLIGVFLLLRVPQARPAPSATPARRSRIPSKRKGRR